MRFFILQKIGGKENEENRLSKCEGYSRLITECLSSRTRHKNIRRCIHWNGCKPLEAAILNYTEFLASEYGG